MRKLTVQFVFLSSLYLLVWFPLAFGLVDSSLLRSHVSRTTDILLLQLQSLSSAIVDAVHLFRLSQRDLAEELPPYSRIALHTALIPSFGSIHFLLNTRQRSSHCSFMKEEFQWIDCCLSIEGTYNQEDLLSSPLNHAE